MQSIGKINKLQNYLDENQVSERLGVSGSLLRKHRWGTKGLPYVKLGSRSLHADPEIVEYRLNRRIETGKNLF